ncbi:unnamed protein product, partial [Acidithrix sp. C25]
VVASCGIVSCIDDLLNTSGREVVEVEESHAIEIDSDRLNPKATQ